MGNYLARLMAGVALLAMSAAQAATLTIGDAKVRAGGKATIPIDFQNDGRAVGLQFDVFLPIDEIAKVDVGKCFAGKFRKYAIAGCRQMDAPNHDVVRYIITTSDLSPLPSGRLANLTLHTKSDAFSGRYRITMAESTAQAVEADGTAMPVSLISSDMQISGGRPASTRIAEVEPILFGGSSFSPAANRAIS